MVQWSMKVWRFRYFSHLTNSTLEASATVAIYKSVEYHLNGDDFDHESNDLFGDDVTLDGNLMAIGTPNKQNPSSEIQTLTVKSDANMQQNEVQ